MMELIDKDFKIVTINVFIFRREKENKHKTKKIEHTKINRCNFKR